MANKKPIIIKDYEYSEFAQDTNQDGQTVLAIYGVDDETLKQLEVGTVIEWHDEGDNLMGVNPMKWNGEIYATFEDFVIVYLY